MKSVITVGRSSHCDIIIPNENISREHARIYVAGGHYVYEDVGKNGSVINGRVINGEKIAVAAGAEILLAGKIPLPWAQIYSMLPLSGVKPYDGETKYHPAGGGYSQKEFVCVAEDNIGVGWGILAFFIPIAGWIMYFVWKDEYPHKASQANIIAWISFVLNFICILASF